MSIFVFQKIVENEIGLKYICETEKRFNASIDLLIVVFELLNNILKNIQEITEYNKRFIKHILIFYKLVSKNPKYLYIIKYRGKEVLKDDNSLLTNIYIQDYIHSNSSLLLDYNSLLSILNV